MVPDQPNALDLVLRLFDFGPCGTQTASLLLSRLARP
jgi:hypothetical protein